MPEPAVVISTVVAGILGGVGLWWSRRQARKAGVGGDQADAIRNLQLLADTWEERFHLEHEERVNAETALATLKASQVIERELAAQCRSDLDDARSKIRLLERRRGARAGE